MSIEGWGHSKVINPYRLFVGSFVPNWLLRQPFLSHGAKLVYARLSQYAGKNGIAHPKLATLADEVGMSERQARRYISELRDNDLIETEDHSADNQPSNYRFLFHPCMTDDEMMPDAPPLTDVAVGPGQICPQAPRSEVSGIRDSLRQEIQLRDSEDSFPHFWNLYPRKLDKKAAVNAWRKLKPTPDVVAKILTRLKIFIRVDWATTEPQFIPYPASWLNGARWEDEIPDTRLPARLTTANAHALQRGAILRAREAANEALGNQRFIDDHKSVLAGAVQRRPDPRALVGAIGADSLFSGEGSSTAAGTNGHGPAIRRAGIR